MPQKLVKKNFELYRVFGHAKIPPSSGMQLYKH